MTLYLKYRPKNLGELDLPGVSTSLKKILSSKDIPHAFLFAGPKGSGKTSAARILAKIVNCEKLGKDLVPCDKCKSCRAVAGGSDLDVNEMDAASHRGIEDIRALRDAVKLAPNSSQKKVYIIDEAHMLTTEASNALLKTLEEPPEHVIFILATTNPEKLLETIRSRTTLVTFRKAKRDELIKSLKRVAKGEKYKTNDGLLGKIADSSGGSFRDAIKILEQVILEGESYLSEISGTGLDNFYREVFKKHTQSALSELQKHIEKGLSAEALVEKLLKDIHLSLLAKYGLYEDGAPIEAGEEELIAATEVFEKAYQDISTSPIEELPLEIAVINYCGRLKENDGNGSSGDDGIKNAKVKLDTTDGIVAEVDENIWSSILSMVKPINASIEALLRSAKPIGYDGKTLTLGVFYKFHKERLEESRHRQILEGVIEKIMNAPTRITCMLVEPSPKKIIEEAKDETVLTESADTDIIKAAEEIFSN